jgi:hypothetical protein
MEACCCWGSAIGQGRYDDLIGEKQRGKRKNGRRTSWAGEDAPMRNESKNHRKDANMYSIDWRTGGESSGSSDFERGRREKE